MEEYQDEKPRNQAIFIALLVLLVWIPIPLGSNRPWALSLMQIGTFIILMVWLINYLRKPYTLPRAIHVSRLPLLLFGLWLTYILLQAATIPDAVLGIMGVYDE